MPADNPKGHDQYITFVLFNDKCNLLTKFKEGDEVVVHFNLKGREANLPQGIKYFNTLEAWKIQPVK